mgnify:CR=1 FL=1
MAMSNSTAVRHVLVLLPLLNLITCSPSVTPVCCLLFVISLNQTTTSVVVGVFLGKELVAKVPAVGPNNNSANSTNTGSNISDDGFISLDQLIESTTAQGQRKEPQVPRPGLVSSVPQSCFCYFILIIFFTTQKKVVMLVGRC